MKKILCQFKTLSLLALCLLLLSACGGDTVRPSPAPFVPPTAPPTPASFDEVPDAATAAAIRRITPTPADVTRPPNTAIAATPTPATASLPDDNRDGAVDSAPDKIDPTVLAKLSGSVGPGSLPGGALPTLVGGTNGRPARSAPTPTLNTSPNQSRIDALRNSKVSFLTAYKQALGRVQQVQAGPKLVFASANILRPDRTAWSFQFLSADGLKMWKVIYDSNGPKLDINEQAPTMQSDASKIDMDKVLDTDELLRRAESNGLKLSWPVDIFNFQVEGTTRQPCFIMTNIAQGKQVAINAYTGAVVRDEFAK
jgi:hypothetical protein